MTEVETHRCQRCGVRSAYREGYVDWKSVIHGPVKLCMTCNVFKRRYGWFYLACVQNALILTVISYGLTRSWPAAVGMAGCVYALFYAAIVVHELGHLVAARALGFEVPIFSVGGGVRAATIRLRNTTLLIGPSAVEGFITLSGHGPDRYRLHHGLVSAAGPMANLLFAVLGFAVFMMIDVPDGADVALTICIGVNVFIGVANLLPMRISGAVGEVSSDGLQLLNLHRMQDDQVTQQIDAARFSHALAELQLGHPQRTLALLDQLSPDSELSAWAQTLRISGLGMLGRIDEGIRECRSLLASAPEAPVRAVAESALAYLLLLTGEADVLDESEQLARSGFATLPMYLGIIATLGAVLIARRSYREGLELLEDDRFRMEPPWNRASVLASRAMAEHGLGRREKATSSLAKAVRLDAEHPMVAMVSAVQSASPDGTASIGA